jgi:hypothetical protein
LARNRHERAFLVGAYPTILASEPFLLAGGALPSAEMGCLAFSARSFGEIWIRKIPRTDAV